MRSELELILASIHLHPSNFDLLSIDKLILEVQDWDYFSNKIIDCGIAPLLYIKLQHLSNTSSIPKQVQSKLRSAYYKTISRSMMLYTAYNEVIEAFIKNDIPVIALKGIYLSDCLYGDIGLRLMSDIDLLVKKHNGDLIIDTLKKIKFEEFFLEEKIAFLKNKVKIIHSYDINEKAHYRPMLKGEVSVEIHTKLQNTSEHYQQSLTDIWANAKPVTINGLPALALDNYNLLIHLCLHLHKHFTVLEHVQFTGFADIVNLLCRFDNGRQTTDDRLPPSPLKGEQEEHPLGRGAKDFVWEEFIAKCKAYKCEEPVFKYLLLCREYFNAPLPDYLYEAYKHTFTDEDRDLFQKHLTGFDFAAQRDNSAVPVHFRNIKHIKNPLLKLRYVVEVVFPGKEFMVEKYLAPQPPKGGEESADGKKLLIINYKLLIRFWWLWYPYRWWVALRAIFSSKR